jgi:hypothetical protein
MILSNQQAKIASTFFVPIMHSREVARKAMHLARTEPERVLAVLPTLTEDDQQELRHLKIAAEKALGSERVVITVPAKATGRKAGRDLGDDLDRFEGLLSSNAIRSVRKLRN